MSIYDGTNLPGAARRAHASPRAPRRALRAWTMLLLAAAAVYGYAAESPAPISVRDARAMATPPGARVGGVFMEIVSSRDDTLTSLSSPVAERVELHESRQEDGIARMRALPQVELQAQRPFALRPGGAHIMLIGLREPLKTGARFPITLHFAKSGEVTVDVDVRSPGAMHDPGQHDHARHDRGSHDRARHDR